MRQFLLIVGVVLLVVGGEMVWKYFPLNLIPVMIGGGLVGWAYARNGHRP